MTIIVNDMSAACLMMTKYIQQQKKMCDNREHAIMGETPLDLSRPCLHKFTFPDFQPFAKRLYSQSIADSISVSASDLMVEYWTRIITGGHLDWFRVINFMRSSYSTSILVLFIVVFFGSDSSCQSKYVHFNMNWYKKVILWLDSTNLLYLIKKLDFQIFVEIAQRKSRFLLSLEDEIEREGCRSGKI